MSAVAPSSSRACHSFRRRVCAARSVGVQLLELRTGPGARSDHQGVLDPGAAGKGDPTMST